MNEKTNLDSQTGPKGLACNLIGPSPEIHHAAPIIEHLADRYGVLKRACWELLNNIKERSPAEDRQVWRCLDFQRISNLIDFK